MVETECFFDGQMPSEKKVRGLFGHAFYDERKIGGKKFNKQTKQPVAKKYLAE
jgi:hypothetical protein